MISRRFLLLVTPIVLLINNDEAKMLHGCKHARARSHNHSRFSLLNAPPLKGPFGFIKRGVQDGYLIAESMKELPSDGGGQGDFGDE